MNLIINKQKLEQVINDFYCATGVSLCIKDANYNVIVATEYKTKTICQIIQDFNLNYCKQDDKILLSKCANSMKPETHICHAGLIDICIPLIYDDEIIGFIIMGQLRRDVPFETMEKQIPIEKTNFVRKIYESMPIYDSKQAQSIANLAVMLALYIMTEGIIKRSERRKLPEDIVQFVHKNLAEPLSVDLICHYVGISKNTLYHHLKLYSGMSVSKYIKYERINAAKKLLIETNTPISQICEKVGISDSAYFCKLFKDETGISPLKFRNSNR